MVALPLTWAAIQAAAWERAAADGEDVPGAPAGELPGEAARVTADAVPVKTPVTRRSTIATSARASRRAGRRKRQAASRRCTDSLTVVARIWPHEGSAGRRGAAFFRTTLPGG